MAHLASKGFYVKALKDMGINNIEGKRLESYKGYVLMNYYFEKTGTATKKEN